MVRVAGCLACLAMLLAMPGLRTLCAEACPPQTRAPEPPCHDEHGGQPPPGDPPGSCAHGNALTSTAVRAALDGAPETGLTAAPHWILHQRPAGDLQRGAAGGPPCAACAAGLRLPPLRC